MAGRTGLQHPHPPRPRSTSSLARREPRTQSLLWLVLAFNQLDGRRWNGWGEVLLSRRRGGWSTLGRKRQGGRSVVALECWTLSVSTRAILIDSGWIFVASTGTYTPWKGSGLTATQGGDFRAEARRRKGCDSPSTASFRSGTSLAGLRRPKHRAQHTDRPASECRRRRLRQLDPSCSRLVLQHRQLCSPLVPGLTGPHTRMADSPVAPSTGKHPRLSSLRSTTEQGSPVSTRQRQLGQIGGKSGPGYSPYARRVATRSQAQQQQQAGGDEGDDEREGEGSPTQQPRQAQGLFGRVRSLPGRMLGLLTRSSSSKQLAASTSLADVRAELDGERQREERQRGQGRAGGMTRSKTSYNIAQAKVASQQPPVAGGISSSSSMSALATLAGGPATAGGRSAHSTLVLPNSASTNGSGAGPSFLTAANLGRHSRAASPALSSASLAQQQRRSPSPLRNGLVGSMSSFQLAQPPSPTAASAIFNPTLGNNVTSNPFGLTSRSPFVSRTAMQPRSPSISGRSVSSVAGGAAASTGHPLFPYSSTLPRGTSPSLTGSVSMRDGLSSAAGPVGQKRPFRAGSPLNPQHHFLSGSATVGSGLSSLAGHGGDEIEMLSDEAGLNGVERARKKQLVWDPQRGLVSRERLEKEKERCVCGPVDSVSQMRSPLLIVKDVERTGKHRPCRRTRRSGSSKSLKGWAGRRSARPSVAPSRCVHPAPLALAGFLTSISAAQAHQRPCTRAVFLPPPSLVNHSFDPLRHAVRRLHISHLGRARSLHNPERPSRKRPSSGPPRARRASPCVDRARARRARARADGGRGA